MEKDDKISIVVPVYNSERKLSKCLESICNQSYDNLEIIVIDDGSKDSSCEIIKKFKNSDKRIIPIYKENTGVSDTRNRGIEIAKGKYLMFVDSDDYLEENACEIMIKSIKSDKNIDIAIGSWNNIYNGLVKKEDIHSGVFEIKDFFSRVETEDYYKIINPLWNKIYKTNIIKENNLKFDLNISLGEDMVFNFKLLLLSNRIKILNESIYNYNISDTGLNMKKRKIEEYEQNAISVLDNLNVYNNIKDAYGFIFYQTCVIINDFAKYTKKQYLYNLVKKIYRLYISNKTIDYVKYIKKKSRKILFFFFKAKQYYFIYKLYYLKAKNMKS